MIYLKILIAFITFLMLVVSRFESGLNDSQSNEGSSLNLIEFTSLDKELLPVEKAWFDAEKEANKPKETVKTETKKTVVDPNALLINGVSYSLMAVFNEQNSAFILLKNEDGEINKLFAGDAISEGVVLKNIQPHRISVKQQEQVFNFDLFKRSNNEQN